jgi:hypothetical protein
MSSSALDFAPTRSTVVGGGIFPDRLTLWPLDHGRYGLDATFLGPWACEDAEEVAAHLYSHDMPYALREDAGGGWTVRLGPISSVQVARALGALIGSSSQALPAAWPAP